MTAIINTRKWEAANEKCKKLRGKGIPEDIDAYGKAQKERADLEEILNYLTWNGTAKPGYIYAKATPRNAGRWMLRCSDPRGECYGQIPMELASKRLECPCGWTSFICKRFMTPLPPEGSEMEVRYINARIKRGFGTKKVAKQARDDESHAKEGELEWGNANPEHRGVYGDPPCPNIAEDGYKKKYWEG